MNRLVLLLGTHLFFNASVVMAQFVPLATLPDVPQNNTNTAANQITSPITTTPSTYYDEKSPEGGSETVAKFLEVLTPGVDTRIPESASQTALRISHLISKGHADIALKEIARLTSTKSNSLGTNVQLMFLKARAYTARGNITKALEIYREMTYRYPELAEPWNNMAILQAQRGSLDDALLSLQMALNIRPDYPIANQNINHIYSLLAQRTLEKSTKSGK